MVDQLWIQKFEKALGERDERLRAESIQFKSFENMRKDSSNWKKVYTQNKITRLKKDNLALLQQKLIREQQIKELKIEEERLKRRLKEGYQPTQPLDLI
jgi:hypothetical protein